VRSGLLHWAATQLTFIPEDVNIVLIGSAMTAEEQAWVCAHIKRPFFNTQLEIDDNAAWEFIFDTSRRSFGWIEIGCFVNNSTLFRELARIDDDVAFNVVYEHTERHRRLFMEYLLFVNIRVIEAMRAKGIDAHPSRYSSRGEVRMEHHNAYHRVPNGRDRDAVRRLLRDATAVSSGRIVEWMAAQHVFTLYFYLGHLFYLHAQQLGFRTRQVRNLTEPSSVIGFHNFFSDEVITAQQVSRYEHAYRGRKFEQDLSMTLQADYAILRPYASSLPAPYAVRLVDLRNKIAASGLNPDEAGKNTIDYLVGLSVSRRVFDAPTWRFLRDDPVPAARPVAEVVS
jgi:hypothetical protein